jgi:hypothetical protein
MSGRSCPGGAERPPPGRHFIEHDAQRKHVRSRIDLFAAQLFGRHVADRADGDTGIRQLVACRACLIVHAVHRAREPEVENLHLPTLRQEDVGRLEVAMEQTLRVGSVQRVRERDGFVQDGIDVERAAPKTLLERLALEQLHDEVRPAVLLADVIQGADIRVVQRRNGARFPLEPRDAVPIALRRGRQHLDGDAAAETSVRGAINLAHAARPDGGEDFIRTESCSCS